MEARYDIVICITIHNRNDIAYRCIGNWNMYLPENSKIVIVDDASIIPIKNSDYRFEKNVGISVAKNKCIEIAYNLGANHIFLSDDDCWPRCHDWWKPYVESPENHLMYIFQDFEGKKLGDTRLLYKDSKHIAYDHPRGCMLYYKRKVFDVVGGMDEIFKKWGYEHGNLSDRIFNAGLTSFRYMDVVGSSDLIYSVDEHTFNKHSSVPHRDRMRLVLQNKHHYDTRIGKTYYHPFAQENVFVTCYFTGAVDTQKKQKWEADIKQLWKLITSIQKTGNKLIVLHDCFDEPKYKNVEFIRVETSLNPYIQRWASYYQLLRSRAFRNVFFIDGTDVEILRTPDWQNLGELLWVGDENEVLNCQWIKAHHNTPRLNKFYKDFANLTLLNAGVVGGSYEVLKEFIRLLVDFCMTEKSVGMTDMAAFNYICRTKFKERVKHGRQVTTVFKNYEYNNVSWIKHK